MNYELRTELYLVNKAIRSLVELHSGLSRRRATTETIKALARHRRDLLRQRRPVPTRDAMTIPVRYRPALPLN